ncbi:MAG: ion channel [Gammaproteobacteria bacterium]
MENFILKDRKTILKSKYFYLLISLILFFLVNPFLVDNHISNLIIVTFFLFIIFFSSYKVAHHPYLIVLTLIIALLSFGSYSYVLWVNPSDMAYGVHFIFSILFLSLITFFVISSLMRQHEITADTLFGAICGYLLIGFTWSFIYLLIVTIDPASFSIHVDHEPARARIDHFIYYSFVTITTIGYGDILALKSVARTFSWLEAVIGQVYLAVWISQLVGLRIIQRKS